MTRVTSDVETLNELFSSGVVTIFGDVFTLVAIMAMMLVIDWRLALVTFAVIPLVWLTAADLPPPGARGVPRHPLPACPAQRVPPGTTLRDAGGPALRSGGGLGPPVRRAQSRAPRGPPAVDHDLRGLLPRRGGADRGGDGAAALVRRAPGAGRHPDGRRPGGVHPVHPPVLPAAAGPLGEVQPAAERHGVVGAGVHAAGRAGDGAGAGAPGCRCRVRCGARSGSRASGSATAPEGPGCSRTSLYASPGQTIALVGHTGAGKTTIVNLLLRFYDPDRGRITVDGVDIRELSTADLRADRSASCSRTCSSSPATSCTT